jgi:asparagine synthetase B (glutamine-hydrolysing)
MTGATSPGVAGDGGRMWPALDDLNLVTLSRYGAFLPTREADWPPEPAPAPLVPELAAAMTTALAGLSQPVAVALSGGVDSSVIAWLAGARAERAYTLDTGRARREASLAAEELGVKLTVLPPAPGGSLDTPLDDVVLGIGRPTHSAAPFGFAQLYRGMRAHGVCAVLTGDGADELFAGHAYHQCPGATWASGAPLWERYRAARGLCAQIPVAAFFRADYLEEYGSRRAWERSEYAAIIERRTRGLRPADALRFLDVALRMRPQCVDLQRHLAARSGLEYAALMADRRVVSAALSLPIDGAAPKQPLRALLVEQLGARWRTVTKEPMHAPTGGRTVHSLPGDWQDALSVETTRRHGIFRHEHLERQMRSLTPSTDYLPRELVIAATTHRYLDLSRNHPQRG